MDPTTPTMPESTPDETAPVTTSVDKIATPSKKFAKPSKIGALLAWDDVKTSAAVYLGVTSLAYFTYGYSALTILCYAMIIQVVVVRAALMVESSFNVKVPYVTKIYTPSADAMERLSKIVIVHVEEISKTYSTFAATDDIYQLGGFLFALYIVGKLGIYFSVPTMLFIAFQVAFIATPVYTKNKSKCDELISMGKVQLQENVVVPASKKFLEVKAQVAEKASPYKEKFLASIGRSPAAKEE